MRKLEINNKGKVIAEDFHVNRTTVTKFGLWFNRLMPPRPLDSAAEYQIFRLLRGVTEEKQAKMVTELAFHEFLMPAQASILMKSSVKTGKTTSKPAITSERALLILERLANGGNGKKAEPVQKKAVPAEENPAIRPGDI